MLTAFARLRSTSAPKARSASSPWSRVRAGSSTVVLPSASSPANSTEVFTCALATGGPIVDAMQLCAADAQRSAVAVGRLDLALPSASAAR